MKNLRVLALVSICVLLISSFGCGRNREAKPAVKRGHAKIGYLKSNIHCQKFYSKNGREIFRASYANYIDPGLNHIIVPVNSKVEIRVESGIRGRGLLITDLDTGRDIHFDYNQRNVNLSFFQYADLILSSELIVLEDFPQIDRQGIKDGKPYAGMSKESVRMALGYPSPHKTLSLEDNTWVYWKNKSTMTFVDFGAEGKVFRVR